MQSRKTYVSFSLFFLVFSISLQAANWPAWRGASGQGIAVEKNLPVSWDTNKNIRWKVALPDRGNSTPIVWQDRVFVTQSIEKEKKRLLLCFDRKTGKQLWSAGVTYTEPEATHATNPYCSASPVTDGTHVIAFFGSAGLYCYDFTGKELWNRPLGKIAHVWGSGASPVLQDDLCFLNFGPGENTYLIALEKKTGRTVWEKKEPGGRFGENQADWIGSWSDPLPIRSLGVSQLIMSWPHRVCSINPKTGEELWTCSGLNPLVYTSPLFSDDTVVAMGGFMGSALAVKTGGSGDVTATHRLWHLPKTKQRIGSGVVRGGHIYILNDPGVAECIELKTGKVVWEERFKAKAAKHSSWSSVVLAGERAYAINHSGETFVFKAEPTFSLVGVNPLGDTTNASLAPSDDEFFIRTDSALWCVSHTGSE